MASTLERECLRPQIFLACGLKFSLSLPIVPERISLRQITALPTFGNELSENPTVPNSQFADFGESRPVEARAASNEPFTEHYEV
ncbi:MAG: hypothetical protein WB341_08865 [Terracidiphilus sp.]